MSIRRRLAVTSATTVGPDAETSRAPAPGGRDAQGAQADLLVAIGIKKSFGRGVWPLRRRQSVLRGADLTLSAGEVVGWSVRTVRVRPR